MSPAVRQATPADLPTVEAITRAAYEGYVPLLGREPLPMQTDHAPMIEAGHVWLVGDDALCVLEPGPDHLLVFSLAVRPGAQGRGLGRWMLRFAEAEARRAGLPEVQLYTHEKMTRNRAIYARAGFRETGGHAPFPDVPEWRVVDMAKRLDP